LKEWADDIPAWDELASKRIPVQHWTGASYGIAEITGTEPGKLALAIIIIQVVSVWTHST
jgi:hypothetical protein